MCQQWVPGSLDAIGNPFILSKGLESILSPSQVKAASMKVVIWDKANPEDKPWQSICLCLHCGVASSCFLLQFLSVCIETFLSLIFLNQYHYREDIRLPSTGLEQDRWSWGSSCTSLLVLVQHRTESNPASHPGAGLNILPGTSWELHMGWMQQGFPLPSVSLGDAGLLANETFPGSDSSKHGAAFNYTWKQRAPQLSHTNDDRASFSTPPSTLHVHMGI